MDSDRFSDQGFTITTDSDKIIEAQKVLDKLGISVQAK